MSESRIRTLCELLRVARGYADEVGLQSMIDRAFRRALTLRQAAFMADANVLALTDEELCPQRGDPS